MISKLGLPAVLVCLILFVCIVSCTDDNTIVGSDPETILPVASGPELTIPQANFNFGKAPQNSRISHVFWLHSTGDEALVIEQVVPG